MIGCAQMPTTIQIPNENTKLSPYAAVTRLLANMVKPVVAIVIAIILSLIIIGSVLVIVLDPGLARNPSPPGSNGSFLLH